MNVFIKYCTCDHVNIIIIILTWLNLFNWSVLICFHDLRTSADLSWNELTEFNLFFFISVNCYINNSEVEIYIYSLFVYCIQFYRKLLLHEQYFNRNFNIWFFLSVCHACYTIIYHFSSFFFSSFSFVSFIIFLSCCFNFFCVVSRLSFFYNFVCLTSVDCVLIFIIYRVVHFPIYIIVDIKDLILFIH